MSAVSRRQGGTVEGSRSPEFGRIWGGTVGRWGPPVIAVAAAQNWNSGRVAGSNGLAEGPDELACLGGGRHCYIPCGQQATCPR